MTTDLLQRLQQRDHDAQIELRHRAMPKLRAIALRILKDSIDAEDAAENVFCDFILDHVDKVRHSYAIDAVLRVTIVRNCTRRQATKGRFDSIEDTPLTDDHHPEARIIRVLDEPKLLARLDECMNKLTSRSRCMVRQRIFRNEKLHAIGQVYGITGVAVGKAIRKALKALHQCMEMLK